MNDCSHIVTIFSNISSSPCVSPERLLWLQVVLESDDQSDLEVRALELTMCDAAGSIPSFQKRLTLLSLDGIGLDSTGSLGCCSSTAPIMLGSLLAASRLSPLRLTPKSESRFSRVPLFYTFLDYSRCTHRLTSSSRRAGQSKHCLKKPETRRVGGLAVRQPAIPN